MASGLDVGAHTHPLTAYPCLIWCGLSPPVQVTKPPLAGSQGKSTWVSLDVASLWLTAMPVTPPLRSCFGQSAERELEILPTLKFKHGSSKLCLSFHEARMEMRFEQEWSLTETTPGAVTISYHLRGVSCLKK